MAALKRRSKPISVTNPNLVSEWDYKKNNPLTPDAAFPGSHLKVWWLCEKGHNWQAALSDRARG